MFLFSLLLLLISHLLNGISANTEIINFSATAAEFSRLPSTDTWSVSKRPRFFITDQAVTYYFFLKKRHILEPENSTLQWNMISAPLEYTLSQSICVDLHEWHPVRNVDVCPHEFWLVLDLDQDGWKGYDKFTLRLSWPAYVRCQIIVLYIASGFDFYLNKIASHRHISSSLWPIISTNNVSQDTSYYYSKSTTQNASKIRTNPNGPHWCSYTINQQ